MTFRFETDYDLETLTAMAKGIRRTVRKSAVVWCISSRRLSF